MADASVRLDDVRVGVSIVKSIAVSRPLRLDKEVSWASIIVVYGSLLRVDAVAGHVEDVVDGVLQ